MKSKELPLGVEQWINGSLEEIRAGMRSALQSRVLEELIAQDEADNCFSLSKRAYSEMPLCDHVWTRVKPPFGFEVIPWIRGQVHIIDEPTGTIVDSCNHAYARSSDGLIICLTTGLFEAYTESNLLPGERLLRLQNKAPDLISIQEDGLGRNGIAILHGEKEVIAKTLFLEYTEV